MKLSKGMNVEIHSYKHNQLLHRIWKRSVVLFQDNHVLVTGNFRTRVVEHDGRSWHTKEPAICFFYDDLWFNVIGMLKKDGIYYYCNLASPYLFDGEAIKYIDYDLDLKVFPDGSYNILDQKEYQNHLNQMDYPVDVQNIIRDQMNELIERIKEKRSPFDGHEIQAYYQEFKLLKKK
ncbi:MAG: DUF402 domain-containing protein [Acholeplasmataceae bacterium]